MVRQQSHFTPPVFPLFVCLHLVLQPAKNGALRQHRGHDHCTSTNRFTAHKHAAQIWGSHAITARTESLLPCKAQHEESFRVVNSNVPKSQGGWEKRALWESSSWRKKHKKKATRTDSFSCLMRTSGMQDPSYSRMISASCARDIQKRRTGETPQKHHASLPFPPLFSKPITNVPARRSREGNQW